MKVFGNYMKKLTIAGALSLGLALASTQASALILSTVGAVAHHRPGHPHHTDHHLSIGLGFGLGFLFLFVFPPVGLLLDEKGPAGLDTVRENLYRTLPFLKGTTEAREIEKMIAKRVTQIRDEVYNSTTTETVFERVKSTLESKDDFKVDEKAQTVWVKLDQDKIQDLLSDGDYSQEQIDLALATLAKF